MRPAGRQLFARIERFVGQPVPLRLRLPETTLAELGFDSMALVALLGELEADHGLSLEQLQSCLNRGCTLGALLDLCSPGTAARSAA
jgi:hypothetical protein